MTEIYMKLYKRSSKTGKNLLKVLGEEGLLDYDRQTPSSKDHTLIRWGCGKPIKMKPNRVINSMKAIKNATNKFNSLKLMSEYGVNVPNFSRRKADMEGIYLARKNTHSAGRDIEVNGTGDFYTEYLPSETEFRVHVFMNRIIGIQEKLPTEEEQTQTTLSRRRLRRRGRTDDVVLRNHANGYVFKLLDIRNASQELRKTAIDSIQAHGLDFGAVDILKLSDRDYCALEVNTAPALEQTMFNIYANAIALELAEWDNVDYWSDFELNDEAIGV